MNAKTFTAYAEDSTVRFPLARFAPRFLGALDPFLEALSRETPESMDPVAVRLTAHVRDETPNGLPPRSTEVDEVSIAACRYSDRYPELYAAHADLVRGLLGVDDETLLHGEDVELSQQRFIRVRYVPKYLMLLALSETIGRVLAMEFMKSYLDAAIAKLPSRPDAPKTLEELRAMQIEFNLQEQGMDWVQAVIGPHQFLNKVTRCRIQIVLSQYDPELMDVVACYPDFALFRHTNPSFVLTRTETLMNGGTCCDSCYHDQRHVESFTHPPSSVFEELR